ncbi:MAG TPA: phage major capsid protein [Candidatus Acidoferrum sp.]|jgi:HK97 family phage major capsid protein
MNIDYGALNSHLVEYNELSEVRNPDALQKRRMAYLQTAIAALRSGASLADVLDADHRNKAKQYGVSLDPPPDARTIEARGWQAVVQKRDMVEGNPAGRLGSYTGLGYFVPTEFFPTVFSAMAAHDVLFDDDACTVLKTTNGRVTTVPLIGDIENVATVVGEAGTQTPTDISATGQAILTAYSYKTPRFVASLESFQDVDESLSVVKLFKSFTADRLARGIAKDLVTGNGSSKPLGLVPSLEAVGVPFVTASGSSGNTGGSETGATTLGSADFAASLENLDEAYAQSPKCAWLMTRKTLVTVSSIINKFGNQLNLVQWVDGEPLIFGVPVRICPSMDQIGASNVPVVLGDLTYWCTRLVIDEKSGIKVYNEADGLVEYGKIGMSCFVRADGELLYKDTNSPAPFTYIRNHS